MSKSTLSKKSMVISATSFIISIGVFIILYLQLEVSFAIGIISSTLIYVVILSLMLLSERYEVSGRMFEWIKRIQVKIDEWNTSIETDSNGDGTITQEISGRVNYGNVKWIPIGIYSASFQPESSNFPIAATDLRTGEPLRVQFMFDFSTYKKINLHFSRSLEKNDRFHCKVRYKLQRAFVFGREDYYMHNVVSDLERIHFRIAFPQDIKVVGTSAEVQTQYGDTLRSSEKPELLSSCLIVWSIRKARIGNSYRLTWQTKKA
jgi:hypothetical protein